MPKPPLPERLEDAVLAERLAAKHHDRRKYIDLVHNLRVHRVHAAGAEPPSVLVTGDEAHHLTHVLRLSAGDDVAVFDGQGHEWLGRITSAVRSGVTIDLEHERTPVAEPSVHLTLAVAVLKGTQLDDVVRDATMLGASAIVPFVSAHVAVLRASLEEPLDGPLAPRRERLRQAVRPGRRAGDR